MCRLPGCRRPAATHNVPPSKYCSPEHGVEFVEKHVIARSTLTRDEIKALVDSAATADEFHRLGSRMPTPPPSALRSYPEEGERLAEIAAERALLEGSRARIERRQQYLRMAQDRRDRILAELKSDPDVPGKVSAICGYDDRFALDDCEWDAWCAAAEGAAAFAAGAIAGRDGVCLKKVCRGHKGWQALCADQQVLAERLRCERIVMLKQEDKRIRQRQLRRAVKSERDGIATRES